MTSLDLPEKAYLVALAHFPQIGSRRGAQLRNQLGAISQAFSAPKERLLETGLPVSVLEAFCHWRETIHVTDLHQQALSYGLTLITEEDDSYPALLKKIPDPPLLLFVEGTLPKNDTPFISIVGSRFATAYGQRVAKDFVTAFAKAGLTLVSGHAYGIDEMVHRTAIANGRASVAVLASGHSELTGRQREIANAILAQGGAIISEFPLGTPALNFHHPIRNRIISGMSAKTVIIEAGLKSGSIMTANLAIDQGRDVYAVPGPIYAPTSAGTNFLLSRGAFPAISAEEIIESLGFVVGGTTAIPAKRQETDSKEVSAILPFLSRQPIHIDELSRRAGLTTQEIATALSELEVTGRIHQIGGMYYILV